ncbi:hypothetical protein BDF22DRAFT_746544 [Syncephalis plumigaleata]|nr:hypothetical protein BDF22DRAFT_746544 [Syncephalis plumigaleata]
MHGNNNVIPSAAERRKRGRPRKDERNNRGATSSKRPEYKASTSVETSDDMDVSFDNVNLDQPWLAMGVDELRKSYGKLHERHRKLRELPEVAAMNEQMKALQAENQHLRMNIVVTSNAASMEQDKLGELQAFNYNARLKEQLELAKEREKSYIDQLEQLQSSELLELYSKLTRTIVTRVTPTIRERLYLISSKKVVMEMRMSIMPTIDAKSDPEMWSRLPDFLREPLLFNQDELPMFFWRVTNHMNHNTKLKVLSRRLLDSPPS